MLGTHEGQKWTSDPLKLKLQIAVNLYVSDGIQTKVLWNIKECS